MTREEAIEYNKNLREYMKITDKKSEYKFLKENYEALEMGIIALEKENIYDDREHYITISRALYDKLIVNYDKALSQEPCDDVISRILKRMWNCRGKHTTSIDKVKMEQIIRDELPSVRPQEQTGHWRHYEGMLICSECGAEFYDDIMEYCGDDVPRCCPNCGAKMVEPTCDTCEYNTAAFMPCNACEDKSEYKPLESEVRNEHTQR